MPSTAFIDALQRIVYGGVAMTATALHEATGGQEVSFTQWRAIVVVGETTEGFRISEVAQRLGASLPATSRLMRRLERRGLMSLERDEADRRATRARLTETGRALRTAVLAHRAAALRSISEAADLPSGAETLATALAAHFEAHGR